SKASVIIEAESAETDSIESIPLILLTDRSKGSVTVFSISAGSAPGRIADTITTSTGVSGISLFGKVKNVETPTSIKISIKKMNNLLRYSINLIDILRFQT